MYSEIVPHTIAAEEVAAKNPSGIVLSGGPSSVYDEESPSLDPGILKLGIPTLGICYGFQVMAQQLNFFKNMAAVGGLLTVAAWGAGAWSFDGNRRGA